MRRLSPTIILVGIIVILAAALVGVLIYLKNQPPQQRGFPALSEIATLEPDSAKWGVNFPNEYSTFLKTADNATRTKYGGSEKFSKLEADTRLVKLFAGYPFSTEYNEERGHEHALEDVRSIKRVNAQTHATCYSCKSSDNPRLWTEMGMAAYDKMFFSEMTPKLNNTIGCANCHEAATMKLVVTNPALDEALKAQGKDWHTFTRQEMRTVVCGNCHVEYYFKGEDKYLTFPWADGTKIEEIIKYYDEMGFNDWIHPDSGAQLLKMQHPEYEMYTADSTHYMAGVACADCHMPYLRDGASKYTDHNIRSPLLHPDETCGVCHSDVTFVVERVDIIQDAVHETLLATEDALVSAINAIKAAGVATNVDKALLEEARQLHRQAQARWDFVSAENSMGFHNSQEALRMLAAATDLARQAELKAVQAVGSAAVLNK
jgi:nitrite reductase (cytochrome c-552)